jgi:hypothetical protein
MWVYVADVLAGTWISQIPCFSAVFCPSGSVRFILMWMLFMFLHRFSGLTSPHSHGILLTHKSSSPKSSFADLSMRELLLPRMWTVFILQRVSCCCATIASRNMRYLVTAGKHVNNTRAIARERIRMQRSRYCWTITKETVFSMSFVPKCYKQGQSSSGFEVEKPCGGGFRYLHRSPASRRRRRKGNPVPGGISRPHCSWGPGPPGCGSLEYETVKCGHESAGLRPENDCASEDQQQL